MNLRQQIIADRTDALAASLGITSDEAFMRIAWSLVTGKSIHSFDPVDIVDGGQDKQIDIFTIEQQSDSADVYIVQSKNSESFSSNVLVQIGNGLKWVFQRPRKDVDKLPNASLRDKIIEYRALQSSIGPSNIRVHVSFVTIGETVALSEEFFQELNGLRSEYSNDTFEEFDIEPIGADELTNLSKQQERQTRRVDAALKLRYDTNNPSLIKYYAQDLQGLVCSIPASEIGKLVNDNPDGAVFDLNIRRFLGSRGAVNRDIQATASNTKSSYEFWFLNNGITIVCDKFDPVTDPDNPHVKLHNLQIVNGCQTATTIAIALKDGKLAPDVRVLTRIYQTQDPALVNKIVLTTNNQNQISSRDLRANDPIQLDMEKAFGIYQYSYERKPRQFDDSDFDVNRLFTNEYVAQAYLATVLKTPSDARARKYKVWGESHSRIFSGKAVEPYIIAAVIAKLVTKWLSESGHSNDRNDVRRLVATRGSFHVTRIAAYLFHGSENWYGNHQDLVAELKLLEEEPEKIADFISQAFEMLVDIISKSTSLSGDVDKALKSSQLDRDIDHLLHGRAK
ncbi:AIPR family protein [Telmatocola sphagniphila]|uniref:AIPR family protein n=1 Tax=Telmatocola sphagniphila TaxID=1123043 RepID=A0A8E6EV75_9BACT|nr:AIPR family protein [Telmatocola sphagniphila]QVL34594.1 AIPR family protein [Telmatocola sphagniphila]